MPILTLEGIVEDGQIRLRDHVTLPEHTKVYVVLPDVEAVPSAHVSSPRLVPPEQATDFAKHVSEVSTEIVTPQATIIRTSRGLSIAGRRLTLYSIMDYLQAGWPPHLIRDEFNLTDKQMTDVMEYIEAHRETVEHEYQAMLQQAEDNRRYWEARNRECLEQLAHMPPQPGQEPLRAKLQAVKARLGMA